MNAYEYPRDYGPRSPSFARATFCSSESGPQLFIAGTASVVGHTSRHVGCPKEQTQEIVHNLRTLIEHAGNMEPRGIGTSHRAIYKVYVRNPDQLLSIRQTLRDPLLNSSPTLLLQGDLCRQELLVEIEGLVTSD
jgi:chorismate lyase/3-hydroxybenzoate synthase